MQRVMIGLVSTVRRMAVRLFCGVSFQLAVDSDIASWKLTPRESRTAVRLGACEGKQVAFLRKGGWLYQAIPFAKGGRCAVSFRLAGDSAQPVDVQLDNRPVGTFTPGPEGYLDCQTAPMTIDEGGHVIKFAVVGDGTALLDDVRILMVPPPSPTEAAAIADDGRVTLFWNRSPGATGYTVYKGSIP